MIGMSPVVGILDLIGVAVFAVSGALAAARAERTIVTFCFFALVTGVGGGTVRDLLIGAPVFWIGVPRYPLACMAMAILVWMAPPRIWSPRALDWFDAIGLAAYAVFGAAKSMALGVPPFTAALMGVVTACVGGIIRDILAGEPSILLRPELYVTAAALASGLFVLLDRSGLPGPWDALVAVAAGFALRALAISRGLALPGYRPPRDRGG